MKTLMLLRHGKSDWQAAFEHDHERPINDRGRRSARTMGRFVQRADQIPDRVVTSSAVRARTTVELAAEAGRWDRMIEVDERIYGASPEDLIQLTRATDDNVQSLMLVGHEPTFSRFAEQLVGHGSIRVPTATVLRIDLGVERWDDVDFGKGQLVWLVPPKLLLGGGFDFTD